MTTPPKKPTFAEFSSDRARLEHIVHELSDTVMAASVSVEELEGGTSIGVWSINDQTRWRLLKQSQERERNLVQTLRQYLMDNEVADSGVEVETKPKTSGAVPYEVGLWAKLDAELTRRNSEASKPELTVLNLAKLSSEHERMEWIASELADALLPAWRDFETLNNTAIVGDHQPLVNLRGALTKLTRIRTVIRSYLGDAVVLGTFLTEIVGVHERPSKWEGGPTRTVVTFRVGERSWKDAYTVGETNLNAASQDSNVIDKLRERWRMLFTHSRPWSAMGSPPIHADSATAQDLIGRKVWVTVTLRNFGGGSRYECVEVVPWAEAATAFAKSATP